MSHGKHTWPLNVPRSTQRRVHTHTHDLQAIFSPLQAQWNIQMGITQEPFVQSDKAVGTSRIVLHQSRRRATVYLWLMFQPLDVADACETTRTKDGHTLPGVEHTTMTSAQIQAIVLRA